MVDAAKGVTGADGSYKIRGFLGDYEISVGHKTVMTKLVREGTEIEIKIEE